MRFVRLETSSRIGLPLTLVTTAVQMWDAEGGEALVAAMREGDLQEYWLALSLLTYIARRSPAWAESVAGLVGLSEVRCAAAVCHYCK